MKEVAPNPVHEKLRHLKHTASVAMAALALAACGGNEKTAPAATETMPPPTIEAEATPPEPAEMCGIVGLEDLGLYDEGCLIEPPN